MEKSKYLREFTFKENRRKKKKQILINGKVNDYKSFKRKR